MISQGVQRARIRETKSARIRYQDHLSREWLWYGAPCRWRGRVELEFLEVPFAALEHAGSGMHHERVEYWLNKLHGGYPIAPPVACRTERSTMYLHDGNHRFEALRRFLGEDDHEASRIRVGVLVPQPGYRFSYRDFGTYGTYVLTYNRKPATSATLVLTLESAWSMGEEQQLVLCGQEG